jgi:hypothetical protein
MPSLPPTPAATPQPNSAASSESKPIATPEPKSATTSFYQQLPQWFLAIFSLAYVSGYLIEFTHFGSFGILDASGEIFKLKYIQTGITFLLLCAIVGVYTILVLGIPSLNSKIRPAVKGGFYLPRWSIFAGAFNVLSIYLAALLTPLPSLETITQAGGTLALVFILVLYSFTLSQVIEKNYEAQRSVVEGKPAKAHLSFFKSLSRRSPLLKSAIALIEKQNARTHSVIYEDQDGTPAKDRAITLRFIRRCSAFIKKAIDIIRKKCAWALSIIYKPRHPTSAKGRAAGVCSLWLRSVRLKNATAIVFLAATVIVDKFVFSTKLTVIRGLFLGGGWIFLVFAICMPLLLLRVIDRLKQVTKFEDENQAFRHTILQAAGITLSLLLLFLVLTSYSYSVFPFIPSAKGGGDYENAPTVSVNFKEDEIAALAQELKMGVRGVQQIRDVILIYATTSSFYFAKSEAGNDPCDWRAGRNRPKIMELRREQILAQSVGGENKDATVTNCKKGKPLSK